MTKERNNFMEYACKLGVVMFDFKMMMKKIYIFNLKIREICSFNQIRPETKQSD